ncbi:right-handed parallel beta-helix repeat-containing protein [Luteimonas viscosa]|uniref:Right-handed parallel beta-helix repeat-containing protein n=1 Tax=Luteimonas viscosa TaxID=1132694 RepID=A0A5D4XIQ9_9GAMM|nr:DUF6519 domain-containing protein [Luteimonas viscosa]TYT23813.1 right-handed parallel beta-helix repeat-containing protein [Luteimonas viscosa]
MATDLSRIRHDPLLDWSGVQLKQGGVLLDADANELVAVLDRRLRALASDVLGRSTVSQTTPDAFRITASGGGLQIGRGRMYVDGLLAENHGGGEAAFDPLLAEPHALDPLDYTAQPYLTDAPDLPTAGRRLVYLDAWNREVTALEDPSLVESAVGVDASSRLQTVWQVRVLDSQLGTGASCATPDGELPGWSALTAPSEGRLTTGTYEVPPLSDPCELPPTGGYRGLENQLYRVEIHDPGLPGGGATFKWSRENASVGARVAAFVSATELELETLGRDEVLGLRDGDWVEILDDAREFAQLPAEIRRISIEDPGNRRATFAPALPADMLPPAFPDDALPAQRNLRVRRWDQAGKVFRVTGAGNTAQLQDLDAPGSTGLIAVPAAGTELILEHGVTVSFASAGTNGFKRGDWWTFAARTADASVEPLEAAPPRGTHHHYARLGIWDIASGSVSDCRTPWPPGGGDDCGCSQCVTPESHASGQLTIQAAVDRLRDRGGTVCLTPGNYALQEPVFLRGARAITIRGQGATTIVTAAGSAFVVETGMALCIEKLSVLSAGLESAIRIQTALGVTLRELIVFAYDGIRDRRSAAVALSGLCAGITLRDNLFVAPDGIRTETANEGAPAFALLGALAIEHNILACQRNGIVFDGSVGHLWDSRIGDNQFTDCPSNGIRVLGLATAGSSLRVEGNNLNLTGHGIVCGTGNAWIESNRVHGTGDTPHVDGNDGIALVPGLDRAGASQVHVLANQVSGFRNTGIAIRARIGDLIAKLNVVRDCGNGIVMAEDAESDSASIENNHVRDITGAPGDADRAIVAGISVLRTAAATIAGNQVRDIARNAQQRISLSAGIVATGVTRSRIHGNEVSGIGPVGDFNGAGVGLLVQAPLDRTEIAHNQVQRDDQTQAGSGAWYALLVGGVASRGVNDAGAVADLDLTAAAAAVHHTVNVSTVRLDTRRTLVLSGDRAYIATAATDLLAASVLARGSVATVIGNMLIARGGSVAVEVRAGGEIMFSDNCCELFDNAQNPAVRLVAPVLVLNANRVRSVTKPSVQLVSQSVAALGNITTHGIDPLPTQWQPFNLNA